MNNNYIYLFSLLVIPAADIIIEKVKINIKLLIYIAILLFGYTYIFSITGNEDIIESSLIYSYIFLITGAITQYVGFILESKHKKVSLLKLGKKSKKGLDDYFYMLYIFIGIIFLIGFSIEVMRFVFTDYSLWKLAGVFLAFTLILIITRKININIKKSLHNNLKDLNGENFTKFRKKINDNKLFKVLSGLEIQNDIVFYLIFIFFTILFSIGYIYNIEELLILSYVIIFLSYITFKIYGFKIETIIVKKDFNSNNYLLNLIVFTIIFTLSTNKILEGYTLNDYKNFIISIFTLIYIYFFSLIFSDFKLNSITQKHITLQKIKYLKIPRFHKKILIISIGLSIIIMSIINKYELLISPPDDKYISQINISENLDDKDFEISEEINNDTKQENNIEITNEDISENEQNNSEDNSNNQELTINDEYSTEQESIEETSTGNMVKIGELYKFNNYLGVENESEDTLKLEEFIKKLGYAVGEVDGKFDIRTKIGLRNVLMYECNWPTTAIGVLGKNAAECIEGLEVERE
ncbi:MAG: hypothetical protein Q8K30_03355 [Candidatus Gracilibacteria bacterium]|nr:hypothetical protein [Candidatus Gracilibacteria bacterium]